jgi:hypothetical protein
LARIVLEIGRENEPVYRKRRSNKIIIVSERESNNAKDDWTKAFFKALTSFARNLPLGK